MPNNLFDITPVSRQIPFDNTTNGFVASETQSAIEEAKQNAEGFPRAGIILLNNGTVTNNQFISYSELLPNTPIGPFAVKTKLNEISWSNQTTNVQFRIDFYKNGTAPANLFYTLTVTSPNSGYGYVSGLNYTFDPGDILRLIYRDDGTNASDFSTTLWVSRIN